jgi:hypothetical protein
MPDHTLTIRTTTSAGDESLSGLTGGRSVRGPAVLAERNNVPLAAVALTSGSVATRPHEPAAHVVGLLRIRRYQLLRQSYHVGPARLLLRQRPDRWVAAV